MKRQASNPLLPTRSTKSQRTETIRSRWHQLFADAAVLARETARHLMNCEINSIARHDRRLTTCSQLLKSQMNMKPCFNRRKASITLALVRSLLIQSSLLVFGNTQIRVQLRAARNLHPLCLPDQNLQMHSMEMQPLFRQHSPRSPLKKIFHAINPTTSQKGQFYLCAAQSSLGGVEITYFFAK